MLMIVGTVSSAASVPLGGSTSLVVMLSISRFVLGLGIGGDYPLAGVITSEFASTSNRGMMIASVFAMQGAGILLAAIVAVVMLSLSRTSIEKDPAGALNFVWRICILAGIVPGICALYFRLQIPESPRFTAEVKGDVSKARQDADSAIRDNNAGRILVVYDAADGRTTNTSSSLAINNTASSASSLQEINEQDMEDEIDAFNSSQSKLTTTTNTTTTLSFLGYFSKWTNLKVLLGTSFTWFCLDVGFYGCNLNTPLILKVFGFGGGITVFDQMWNIAVGNLVVALLGAVPGYIASVLLIEKMGRRKIQFMGFAVLTILFAVLAAFFNQISSSPVLFVFLYALVQFFNNFGPNTTTFVVAAEVVRTLR